MTKYYQAVGSDLSKARGGPDRKKGWGRSFVSELALGGV